MKDHPRKGVRATDLPRGVESRRLFGAGFRIVAGVVALVLIAAAVPPRPAKVEAAPPFEHVFQSKFRGEPFDAKALELVGKYAPDLVKMERKGLRIAIPSGLGKPPPIGVKPRFRVHGDFDISTDFEILKATRPSDGYGIGVELMVEVPSTEEATISWSYRAGDAGMNFTSMKITGPLEKRNYQSKSAPATARSGTLRLTRRGPIVTASYRDGLKAKETVLREIDLGTDDVTVVRVSAHTGWSDHPLDCRLLGLTIAADDLPGYGGPPAEEASDGRLLWLLAAGGAVLALGGGAAAGRARRNRDAEPQP